MIMLSRVGSRFRREFQSESAAKRADSGGEKKKEERMSINVNYDPETGVLETTLSGSVTRPVLEEATAQAAALARDNDCTLFLSDCRQIEAEFSVFDVYDLPEIQTEHGIERSARIALVAPTTKLGKKMAEFYETVSVNRSWSARVFEDRLDTLNWLLANQS